MDQDTKTDRIVAWGTIPVIILAVIVWMWWSIQLDEKRNIAMQAYEDCTLEHYKMTPAAYYNEHGSLPTCDFASTTEVAKN